MSEMWLKMDMVSVPHEMTKKGWFLAVTDLKSWNSSLPVPEKSFIWLYGRGIYFTGGGQAPGRNRKSLTGWHRFSGRQKGLIITIMLNRTAMRCESVN
jgi:hypothetical protein